MLRWLRFNGVGALGIAVQLAMLMALVRGAGADYLWATAIAVEAAVLHNFCWHERWTWRHRPSASAAGLLGRLARFHLVNGAISMAGNLAVVGLLTGRLGLDPLVANIVAILCCALVNFAASEVIVFTRVAAVPLVLVLAQPITTTSLNAAAPAASEMLAVDLQAATLKAWTAYDQRVDGRYQDATAASTPFFALDAFAVANWRATVRAGDVAMARMERARPSDADLDVPDGKIHHWTGAIFVPRTTVAAVLGRLAALAGAESAHYPDVIASKRLSAEPDRYRLYLKLQRSKVITATYNTEHEVVYRRLGTSRAAARSVATRIAELDEAGTPREREKPIGADSGYLWRLNAYWRYEAVDGGVLIECESISLSRAVPRLLRPFISGVVEGLARESLERTLTGLRTVLQKHEQGG